MYILCDNSVVKSNIHLKVMSERVQLQFTHHVVNDLIYNLYSDFLTKLKKKKNSHPNLIALAHKTKVR
jgi:hypothetical protein